MATRSNTRPPKGGSPKAAQLVAPPDEGARPGTTAAPAILGEHIQQTALNPLPLAPAGQYAGECIGGFLPDCGDEIPLGKVEDHELGFAISDHDVLIVRAIPPEGFRRGGRYWSGATPVNVPASDLTDEQLAAIMSEPLLSVAIRVDLVEDEQ